MRNTFTPQEIIFIKEHAKDMFDDELTDALNKKFKKQHKLDAVKKRRQREGIVKERGKGVCRQVPAQIVSKALELRRLRQQDQK